MEDEVNSRLSHYGDRRRYQEPLSLFCDRKIDDEPEELTSRISTNKVANTKRRLALPFHDKERVDIALATNMISVGLDITRLGLMVVLGQPKTTAEYIQATSRVGREAEKPGLVVTLLNIHRPRDRSHYERFQIWHDTFYRTVEASSVTPFSPRAIDRGLSGVTVALARLGNPEMTAPLGAAQITQHRLLLDFVVDAIVKRAEGHSPLKADEAESLRQEIRRQVIDRLDTWQHIAVQDQRLQYQRNEIEMAAPLLLDALDPKADKESSGLGAVKCCCCWGGERVLCGCSVAASEGCSVRVSVFWGIAGRCGCFMVSIFLATASKSSNGKVFVVSKSSGRISIKANLKACSVVPSCSTASAILISVAGISITVADVRILFAGIVYAPILCNCSCAFL
ncbi:hypothetical protein LC653_43995 [Nostoc sp. CHAB 5784]|nr:hypothetical protein [Nostoc mirabile CHAB5784]